MTDQNPLGPASRRDYERLAVMSNYRIEILFCGDAPDDELDRARILGSPDVAEAVLHLSKALEGHGFAHEVRAQTIRRNQRKRPQSFPREAAAE